MRPSKYLPKIGTFDGERFWKDAYAHQRARLLKLAGVDEGQISSLINSQYRQLPFDVRFAIETGGIDRRDLE